ncbi:MAG TPA: beta-ketoacyl synthase N-terminal-like domain-containing protein, partial [Thermoanaerobaculia bacterium]
MRIPQTNIRLAITGLGILCSIGSNRDEVWRAITESRDGFGPLTRFPGETFPTDIAAEVNGDFNAAIQRFPRNEIRRMSRTDRLAVVAADEAIRQAEASGHPIARDRTIVSSGTSTGGLLEGESYYFKRLIRGRRKTPPSSVL